MTTVFSHSTHERNIQQLSAVLAATCLALTVLLPIAVIVYWLLADAHELAMRANLPAGAVAVPLALWQRITAAFATEIPLGMVLIGLWHARRCFNFFQRGRVFSAETVACLRRFAGWVTVSVFAAIIVSAAISVMLTLNNPPGLRHLAIGIGSDQVFTLFFAGMVWLMAAVIGQGEALADENASFV